MSSTEEWKVGFLGQPDPSPRRARQYSFRAVDEMYLVACEFTMADGSRHQGFGTPAFKQDDMGIIQPQIFSLSGRRHAFWLGMFPPPEEISGFYTDFGKEPSAVFPVKFSALPGTRFESLHSRTVRDPILFLLFSDRLPNIEPDHRSPLPLSKLAQKRAFYLSLFTLG